MLVCIAGKSEVDVCFTELDFTNSKEVLVFCLFLTLYLGSAPICWASVQTNFLHTVENVTYSLPGSWPQLSDNLPSSNKLKKDSILPTPVHVTSPGSIFMVRKKEYHTNWTYVICSKIIFYSQEYCGWQPQNYYKTETRSSNSPEKVDIKTEAN